MSENIEDAIAAMEQRDSLNDCIGDQRAPYRREDHRFARRVQSGEIITAERRALLGAAEDDCNYDVKCIDAGMDGIPMCIGCWARYVLGWRRDTVHVEPVNDLIEHLYDDCPCGPTTEPVERDDGSFGWLVIHHSLDGGETDDARAGGPDE